MLAAGATALVSWGSAAGLASDLQAGAAVVPEFIVGSGGDRWSIDAAWRTRLMTALRSSPIKPHGGTLAVAPGMLMTAADKLRLYRASGALAADMESAAIAAAARHRRCPFLCVRAVADTAAMGIPPVLPPLLDDFGRPRLPALMQLLLRRPALIPVLLHLGRSFRAATRSLRVIASDAGGVLGLADDR